MKRSSRSPGSSSSSPCLRYRALAALLLALSGLVGCASSDPPPATRTYELGAAPVFSGLSGQLSQICSDARPSLVRIQTDGRVFKPVSRYLYGIADTLFAALNPHPYWEWPYRVIRFPLFLVFGHLDLSSSRGSGFFVGKDLVVSCSHVIDNAAEIRCQLDDGRVLVATVVRDDPDRDLCLLRLEKLQAPFPRPLRLRRQRVAAGEVALALGFPAREPIRDPSVPRAPFDEDLQRLNPRVTVGVVSASDVQLGNALTRYVELDAALNPGNSGGPILGLDGRVTGVATMVSVGKENEGYAVPIETVLAVFGEYLDEPNDDDDEASESRE